MTSIFDSDEFGVSLAVILGTPFLWLWIRYRIRSDEHLSLLLHHMLELGVSEFRAVLFIYEHERDDGKEKA